MNDRPVNQPMMKVWRPQGFVGVEVERFDKQDDLVIPSSVLTGHELTVILEGDARLKYSGERYRFTEIDHLFLAQHPGEVLFANTGSNKPTSVWTLRLYPEAMTQLKADLELPDAFNYFPEMTAPKGFNDTLASLTSDTIRLFDEPASDLERESRLLELVHAVLTHCSDTVPPECKLGKEHKAVALVKEVLQTHLEYNHRLEDLAQLTGLNQHYLVEVFKRDVGLSPHLYQTSVRIHKAKDLLVQGTAIAQVAVEMGFSDQSHLTHTFRKYVQVTPGRFQRDSLKAAERVRR